MKKTNLLTSIFVFSLTFAGCANAPSQEKDAEKDIKNVEVTVTDTTSEEGEDKEKEDSKSEADSAQDNVTTDEDMSGYVESKNLSNVALDSRPQVVKDYYIVKNKSNTYSILDNMGEVLSDGYTRVTFIGDDALLEKGDLSYTLDYAAGAVDENNVGGLGGVYTLVYAYDEAQDKVVENPEGLAMIDLDTWTTPIEDNLPMSDNAIIYSKDDVLNVFNNNADCPTYVWNIKSNKVTGPYTKGMENIINYDPDTLNFLWLSNIVKEFDGIYPVAKENGYQITNGEEVSSLVYEKAIPVAMDAIYVEDRGTKGLLISSIDDVVTLPDSAKQASLPNKDTIMILKDDGWYLYEKEGQESTEETTDNVDTSDKIDSEGD